MTHLYDEDNNLGKKLTYVYGAEFNLSLNLEYKVFQKSMPHSKYSYIIYYK